LQKRAGGVAQGSGVGPEFKPQHHRKNKNQTKPKQQKTPQKLTPFLGLK
jgi:hypothetical protein